MNEAAEPEVEERPVREGPGAVERFARGFSAPVVLLALVGGAVTGWATRGPEVAGPAPAPTTPAPPPVAPPEELPGEQGGEQPGPQPAPAATRADVEALLARGELRGAREQAQAGGFADLAERASLLLAFTENVVLGAWGQADAALRLTTREGKTVLGTLEREQGGTLELVTWDGERQALARDAIQERTILRGAEKARALGEALRAAREALGASPSGLAVHRLAFLAFRGGDAASGTRLLIEALSSGEGTILVDMFGSGDFALLHRARQALVGGGAAPPPPPPPPPVRPDPEPITSPPPPDEEPPPRPRPDPARDPLERDPDWRRTETLYQEGLALYKDSFGASVQAGAPMVKGALKRFQQAQELLDRLLSRFPDDARVEQRMMTMNTLVLDCNKRLGTD